jgi:retron-type reverse transcriptase
VLERIDIPDRHQFRKPHLPQGSPASPALANLAVFTLDKRLSALARSVGANYSRYADDLSFSGDSHVAGMLLRAVPRIVEYEGFQLNSAKTRIMSKTSRQVVTGVVVNRHLNVNRQAFDQLKAIIHACGKADDLRLNDPVFRTSLLGKIGWVETVNPHRGQKLLELLSTAMAKRN